MADDNLINPVSLDGLDDSRRALLELLNGMRRTLHLYTPMVRPDLYDDPEVLDLIRARVVDQPKLRLHRVLPPAKEWRNDCPRLARLAERLTGHSAEAVAFATEAPFLQALGMETIVMGPGSIDRAHQPDEYLELDQIQPCIALLQQCIRHYCL